MVQIFLIGIAAGAAAALLFASVASGSMFSVLLFYLAPLPILIAAIGWSHAAGLIASISAAAALAAVFDGIFFAAFLVGVGLPAWWLGYLALLARPAGEEPSGTVEWYPPGRLVVWAAVLGAAAVTVGILNFGTDAEAFRAGLKRAFERIIRIQMQAPADAPLQIPGISDPGRLIDFLVAAIPPTAAVLATITNLINLWLAARIVSVSGRLKRPWPDLAAITFPPLVSAVLAAAIAGSFMPGLVGIIAGVLAAIRHPAQDHRRHVRPRGHPGRGLWRGRRVRVAGADDDAAGPGRHGARCPQARCGQTRPAAATHLT